jgi:hypothetical protein
MDKIEVDISSEVKGRKLEMLELIDKLTIGDLNKMERLNATEFV